MKSSLAILSLCAASAQTQCFTITVHSKFSSDGGKQTEEHHTVEAFGPRGSGGCSVAALDPGLTRRFYLVNVHATSSGRSGSDTGSARVDVVDDTNRETSVEVTRGESGATIDFGAHSPTPSDDNCAHCMHACAAGDFSPAPTFQLTEEELTHFATVTKTLSMTVKTETTDCTGTTIATLNGTLGSEDEMVLEPASDYASWLPAPDAKEMQGIRFTPSSRLAVKARIQPKQGAGEARSARIEFHLEDVTRHAGVCGNYPRGGADKDDLKFADEQPEGIVVEGKTAHTTDDVTEATVYVQAADFAAWGRITASAPKLSLRALYKPANTYSLTIPRDDDGNKIADAWEGSSLDAQADDEDISGQNAKGDGLTVAAEYRGLVVLENGEKVHHRLDPKRKELLVIDAGGIFDTDAWARASQIVAYKLDESMVQGGSGPASRIVNFLSPAGRPKYAVRLETMSGTKDPDPGGADSQWGYTTPFVISSPKDVLLCRVFKDRIRATMNELYLWLGKALTVRGSPEEAELNELGLPRFVAQNALTQLSGGGLDQLVGQIVRMSAIHEVGHASGVPGHVNEQGEEDASGPRICPMRYRTKKGSQRGLILQVLFGPDAALPGETKMFCRTEFDCFRKLNVKD